MKQMTVGRRITLGFAAVLIAADAINRAKKRRADMVVTTQKDAVRFPKLDRRDVPIWFMRVEIKITAGAGGFDEAVRRICFK